MSLLSVDVAQPTTEFHSSSGVMLDQESLRSQPRESLVEPPGISGSRRAIYCASFCYYKELFMKETDREHKLYAMRHSMAHIMATAVQELYPEAKFGIGPVVENGFYYDMELANALSTEDLEKIETKMAEVVKADYAFEHSTMDLDEAIGYFEDKKQIYKLDLLNDLKMHGTTVAKDIDRAQLGLAEGEGVEEVSIYTDGPFTDLCRGPHVESTGKVGVFKLMRVSGAYWRGDDKKAQLQRIYGVGFTTAKAGSRTGSVCSKRDRRGWITIIYSARNNIDQ
jgi:threonyl-tRNA synthetase